MIDGLSEGRSEGKFSKVSDSIMEGLPLGTLDGESDGRIEGMSLETSSATIIIGESRSSMYSDTEIEGKSLDKIDFAFEFEIVGLPLGTAEGLSDGRREGISLCGNRCAIVR